jgi:hypothetical protein
MPIETLKDALSAGWRVHVRCMNGQLEYTRSAARCRYQAELSLETLVWTHGRNMSLVGLHERMMCPRCGNRPVNLIFDCHLDCRAAASVEPGKLRGCRPGVSKGQEMKAGHPPAAVARRSAWATEAARARLRRTAARSGRPAAK